jgi:hypothetical protein
MTDASPDGYRIVREAERFYVEHEPSGARSGAYNEAGAEHLLWIIRIQAAAKLGFR